MKKILLGAGCFWGVEHKLSKLSGVLRTEVGYAGGEKNNPTYQEVCTDQTGHAEVVLVEFDQTKISLSMLLDEFFKLHDPTTLNRQGPDVGTQYRSVIMVYEKEQINLANEAIKRHSPRFKNPVVTKVEMMTSYYPAEEYHQKYLHKKGIDSCSY
jgi:peptide-methionine (S)-S-oxide reductase